MAVSSPIITRKRKSFDPALRNEKETDVRPGNEESFSWKWCLISGLIPSATTNIMMESALDIVDQGLKIAKKLPRTSDQS